MQTETNLENSRLSVKIAGRLDTNTAPDLEAAIKLDGVNEVGFDIAQLEYIASAGLRVLMSVQKKMMAVGGKMTIAGANDTVRNVFEITGLSSIFELV